MNRYLPFLKMCLQIQHSILFYSAVCYIVVVFTYTLTHYHSSLLHTFTCSFYKQGCTINKKVLNQIMYITGLRLYEYYIVYIVKCKI